MEFTLVTTCLNEMKSLPTWQKDIEAQTRQPDEIVIVDAESTDGTVERLRAWSAQQPRLKIKVEKCNVARGRNIAIEMATHEHIVSTDMGVRLSAKWFEHIVRPFEEDSTVQVVAGSHAIDRSSVRGAVARAEYYLENGGWAKLGPGFMPGNRSIAYTRRVHKELGGLPEDLTMCADDSVFGRQILQAGYKMALAPDAVVFWARPDTLRDFWKERFRYGRGDGEALIKTPIAFRLYKRGSLPRFLVPALTGVRVLTKQLTLRKMWKAIHKGDFIACLYMLILLSGNGYYFGKGYLIGDKWGEKHCQECRKRLTRSL